MRRIPDDHVSAGRGAALYAALVSQSAIGAFCVKTDGRWTVLSANARFCDMLGYPSPEALLLAQAGGQALLSPPASALVPGDVDIEISATHADGGARVLRAVGVWEDGVLCASALDTTRQHEEFDRLSLRSREREIVVAQSGKHIQRFDIRTGRIERAYDAHKLFALFHDVGDTPEEFAKSGVISPESLQEYTAFYDAMRRGEKTGACDVRARRADGELAWYHCDYALIEDGRGQPLYSVISFFDNTIQREKDLAYARWQSAIAVMAQDSAAYAEVNITRDRVEHEEGMEGQPVATVAQFAARGAQRIVSRADAAAYREFFNRDRLLSLFFSGVSEDNLEYRAGDPPQWFRANVQMVKFPYSDDVKGFVVLTNIDKTRRELERLARLAARDSLTHILNRDAAEKRIADVLRASSPGDVFVAYMIDLDNFKQVNDRLGHQQGDRTLIEAAAVIAGVFRATDVVGRLGGDEFLVFLPDGASARVARKKAAALIDALQMTVGGANGVALSASVGVAVVKGGECTFDTVYKLADSALYAAKRSGKNRFHVLNSAAAADMGELSAPVSSAVQLQALMQYMDGGVLLAEMSSPVRLLYASPGFVASCGKDWAEGDSTGDVVFSRIYPQDVKALEAAMRQGARDKQPVDHTFRAFDARGEVVWRHARAVRIPYEQSENAVMIVVLTDITQIKRQEQALLESSERMRIALDQLSQTLWEVDLKTRAFSVFDVERQSYVDALMRAPVPEALIADGFVHQESAAAFSAFFRELLAGKEEDGAAFIVRYMRSGEMGWARMSYHMMRDGDGQPVKAIGLMEELPAIFSEQAHFQQERLLWDALRERMLAACEVDLTDDRALRASGALDGGEERYTALYEAVRARLWAPEDKPHCDARFSREALLSAFDAGVRTTTSEYQFVSSGGGIRWAAVSVNLLQEPVSHAVHAFLYAHDIDTRKRFELSLPGRVERDAMTHLYSRETGEAIIKDVLRRRSGSDARCALALIDIQGLDTVAELLSDELAERLRHSIVRLFRILLDGECVMAQHSATRMLLLFLDVPSDNWIRQRVTEVIANVQRLRETINMRERVTFVSGVATARHDRADYDTLYTQAEYVVDSLAPGRADAVATFEQGAGRRRDEAYETGERQLSAVHSAEGTRPLTVEEKEAELACLVDMLKAEEYDAFMDAMLRNICAFYQADSAYTLSLTEDDSALVTVREWTQTNKPNLFERTGDMRVSSYPVIGEAMRTGEAVLLSETAAQPLGGKTRTRRFICLPVLYQTVAVAFLCVENPRAHASETALLLSLMPIAMRERERFDARTGGASQNGRDDMTGLRGRDLFLQAARGMSSETLSSLGVLHMDVHGLQRVNRKFGADQGDRLILLAAKTLLATFPRMAIFRVSGHEFCVLHQNVTHEQFLDACRRTVSLLEGAHPNRFCVGYTWADRDFTARKLCDHAESLMRYNKRLTAGMESDPMADEYFTTRATLQKTIENGQFAMYVQPRVDIETGKVVGGEALARFIDEKRGVVMPGEFIALLERSNAIRELDLFMLDSALGIMQSWQERGLRVLPISINFSRQTLLDRQAPGQTQEIAARHALPPGSVEIEITESIGNIERETIARAVQGFRELGFRMSLDDFGAEYSSLSLLARVPFDVIKLDKSLINDCVTVGVSRSIIRSMVGICSDISACCVAEGVEREEQARALLAAGCRFAQGYYYSKPIPIGEFERLYVTELE